jgi:hypothetical protein
VNADRRQRPGSHSSSVRPGRPLDLSTDTPGRSVSGGVSALDRLTLGLGVAVAVVIAGCSYAVSATSLYALGRAAGYAPWQAVAVPVVADGPAIYGMFRIISRSRRRAPGAGYGWLLVGAGTAASIGGNVAHAQPDLVAQGIAAAIPLAVLAMLEGLKGDADQAARFTATQGSDPEGQPGPLGLDPSPTLDSITVRRLDTPNHTGAERGGRAAGALAARSAPPDTGVQGRLRAAYTQPRPDGRPWTARTLAQAAGCGHSTAATFLRAQRDQTSEGPR